MINLERRGGDFTCENMMLHDTSAFFATRVILFLMFEKVFFYNHVCVEIIFLCVMIMSNCVIIFSVSAEIVTRHESDKTVTFCERPDRSSLQTFTVSDLHITESIYIITNAGKR